MTSHRRIVFDFDDLKMMSTKIRHQNFLRMTDRIAARLPLFLFVFIALTPIAVLGQGGFFPEGEKLTYRILFDGYENAGYAELHVVGRGRLENRDAVEIRTRLKTTNFVGAALIRANETRIAYADPVTGASFFTKVIEDPDGFARERAIDMRSGGSVSDLVSLIYALRRQTGIGSVPFVENGKEYVANFKDGKSERVRTGGGDFDTVITAVESPFFKDVGIWEVRVNFSNDSRRIPVELRLRTKMGKMRISLASFQDSKSVSTNKTIVAPASPVESVGIVPADLLSEGVPFAYRETTTLKISKGNRPIGDMSLKVGARSTDGGKPSVLLSAAFNVSPSEDIPIKSGDNFQTKIDVMTLLPSESVVKMSSSWDIVSGRFKYDQENGNFLRGEGESGSMANGTHDLLSLLFAIRAFNLLPSNAPSSPVNDTRVSVVLGSRNMVFTIRPNQVESLAINSKKLKAQMLTIVTGDPSIDQLSPRVWLGVSKERPILKISIGEFTVESF